MSKNSFLNRPIVGDTPQRKKKKGGLRWWHILTILFLLGGISALVEKIKASSHPVLFAMLIVGGIVTVGICIFLILRHGKKKRTAAIDTVELPSRPTPAHINVPPIVQPAPAPAKQEPSKTIHTASGQLFIPEKDRQNLHFLPNVIDGKALKYSYEAHLVMLPDVCGVADLIGKTGKSLDIVLEPENEYDPRAVALYLEGKKIGYVHKGRLQDMIHDWLERGDEMLCCLKRLTAEDAYFLIGFYKDFKYFKGRTFKLIGVTKKDGEGISRARNAEVLSPGDSVWVFVDDDKYIVTDGPLDFGELPKAAIEYAEGASRIVGKVEECDFDDNGKPEIYVTIYPIK